MRGVSRYVTPIFIQVSLLFIKYCIVVFTMEVEIMTNAQAWDYAIGMIKVDGLEPTKDFKEYIEKEKRGEVTMEDAKRFLDKKYKMKENADA